MNAREIVAQAREQKVAKYLEALAKLSQEYGLILKPGFATVEGSEFIRPVSTVEDMPGWEPSPGESHSEKVASESFD